MNLVRKKIYWEKKNIGFDFRDLPYIYQIKFL